MAWIESHQALEKHPKVIQLSKACGWSIPETIGRLHMFWWWCLDYATDGRLDRFDHDTIANAFGVHEHGTNVVQVLIKIKFLDSEPEIRVHDWWDYAGRFLQVRYKRHPKIWKEIKRFYGHAIQRTNNRTTTEQQPTNNHKPNQPNQPNQRSTARHISDEDWLKQIKENPAYSHINTDTELAKIDAWLSTRPGRQKTRRFVVNWLNKIEKPLIVQTAPLVRRLVL